jgi:hypothetical protein
MFSPSPGRPGGSGDDVADHREEEQRDPERVSVAMTEIPEAEQVWYDYCFKHEEVARELDRIETPQKYSAGNIARHESLDDFDRQTVMRRVGPPPKQDDERL